MIEIAVGSFLAFLSAFGLLLLAFFGFRADSGRLRLWRIKESQPHMADIASAEEESGIVFGGDSSLVNRFVPSSGALPRQSFETEGPVRKRLVRAGYRRRDAVVVYSAIRFFALVGSGVFVFLPLWLLGFGEMSSVGTGIIVGLSCFLFPSMHLDRRISFRKANIEKHLPSAIDLLAVSVDAGMGISQAFSRVADELKRLSPVLAEELKLVASQTQAGKTNADAMREFADRVESKELALLVNTLIQTERFGTNVVEALQGHSEDMRSYQLQAAEERAGRAAILMLMPTSLIMLAILVLILGLGGIKAAMLIG